MTYLLRLPSLAYIIRGYFVEIYMYVNIVRRTSLTRLFCDYVLNMFSTRKIFPHVCISVDV